MLEHQTAARVMRDQLILVAAAAVALPPRLELPMPEVLVDQVL
jgi:hypothetical protein